MAENKEWKNTEDELAKQLNKKYPPITVKDLRKLKRSYGKAIFKRVHKKVKTTFA